MGTRHLIAVVCDGAYRIAQYGQWDGYPNGQGSDVLEFLRSVDVGEFRKRVRATRFTTDEERQAKWNAYLAAHHPKVDPQDQWVALDVSEGFGGQYPALSRDTGANILHLVLNGETELRDSLEFAADSLFCEWAYVIDLDANTFEVFKGFNQKPLADGERFAFLNAKRDGDYHPVRRVAAWPLNALPANRDAFIAACGPDDDEEAAE